jgi:hypothetical protein
MLIISLLLLMVGAASALLGFQLFRVLLPLVGLVAGTVIGFTGFQGVFGSGAVSTTVAVFVAIAVGILMAVLSYLFFGVAVTVFYGLVGASALSFLGIALGLNQNGFVVFLLGLAGFIMAASYAMSTPSNESLIIAMTSLVGVALVLAGVFLVVGEVTLNELSEQGVVSSVLRVVDQSFLWLFVWLGGSLVAMQLQARTLTNEILGSQYQYNVKNK